MDNRASGRRFTHRLGVAVVGALMLGSAASGAAAAAPLASTPPAMMARVLSTFHEVEAPSEDFALDNAKPVSTGDGHGGTLTAVVGTRSPSADGYGQLVFFFHGHQFVGVSAWREASEIRRLAADGVGRFVVTYANYTKNDAMYDPTLPPVTVTYQYRAGHMVASRRLAAGVFDRISVYRGPSVAQVRTLMASVHEVGTAGEHMALMSATPTITANGQGGMLSAYVGVRWPTADGYGQVVFFYDGTEFVGVSSVDEATAIQRVTADGVGRFRVTYANYTAKDATDDPTLPPVTIQYAWNGRTMAAQASLPKGVKNGLAIALPR